MYFPNDYLFIVFHSWQHIASCFQKGKIYEKHKVLMALIKKQMVLI